MSDFGSDPYQDLPDDPEEAFLKLESHFRAECDRQLGALEHNDRTDIVYVDYIARVLAAIKALELEGEFKSEVPSIEDVNFNTYLNFNKDVMHYCTMLRIRRSQREQGYSVQFDETARRKVHHHLDQVLDIFQKLEVDDRKREKLISRLNDLQAEVDQRRTRFDRFAALTMEVAGVIGDAAERSKIVDILDAVGRVFWGSQTEKQKQLPAPRQKKIEPPKPKVEERKQPEMDDDIPF
ncbi:hypothetical protein SAMN05216573_102174 [Bradyrhizobium sp. Rc3b]|uniref:hypothetical protein n=1 Tax=Bradyrhizobium sp. Rc3b TaxID=1855322 RepID=UPI0008E7F034|nr:hypothetical protein [Bradyrhizobium sp. Rc3b]SFM50664.1 hypothetical protein SAMN05216573_102174 [Bradyrhizobium sp. Rc3b]